MAAGSGSNPSCAKIAALSKKTCISYCQRARGLTVVAATGTSMRRVTSPDNVRRDLLELRPALCMAGVALGGQVIVRKQSQAQGAGFVVFAGAWRPLR